MKDANRSIIAFKKCIELDPNNDKAKVQLYYLKHLTDNKNKNYDIITEIDKIPNISNNKLLTLVRCKIYLELKEYNKAKLESDNLLKLSKRYYINDISFLYQLQKYSDFWLYLLKYYEINFI